MNRYLAIAAILFLGMTPATAYGGGLQQQAPSTILPADFVVGITNPYLPYTPGTKLQYREETPEGTQTIEVAVTHDTKVILGVTCIVAHDTVTANGALKEDTYDWYAQDRAGNVWYFGEDTKEYQGGGKIGTEGSWEAGVDGAKPGIVMQGRPEVGAPYRQEYYAGKAEDMAQVLSLNEAVTAPYGSFSGCVKTKDWSALDPEVVENKWFCRDVGMVRAQIVQGDTGLEELVAVTTN